MIFLDIFANHDEDEIDDGEEMDESDDIDEDDDCRAEDDGSNISSSEDEHRSMKRSNGLNKTNQHLGSFMHSFD
jgi:hypothetical protein